MKRLAVLMLALLCLPVPGSADLCKTCVVQNCTYGVCKDNCCEIIRCRAETVTVTPGIVRDEETFPVAFLAPLKIDGPAQIEPYKLVRLTADGGPDVGYIWDISPDGVADMDDSVPGRLLFVAPPGKYDVKLRVVDFKSKTITTSRTTVVIGVPVPPKPPDPPTPVEPTDPLWPAVKAAYQQSPNLEGARTLAELYRQAAATTIKDMTIETDAQLQAKLHGAAESTVGTALQPLRRVLADEVNRVVKPTNLSKLTDEKRKQYAELFTRFSVLLEVVR